MYIDGVYWRLFVFVADSPDLPRPLPHARIYHMHVKLSQATNVKPHSNTTIRTTCQRLLNQTRWLAVIQYCLSGEKKITSSLWINLYNSIELATYIRLRWRSCWNTGRLRLRSRAPGLPCCMCLQKKQIKTERSLTRNGRRTIHMIIFALGLLGRLTLSPPPASQQTDLPIQFCFSSTETNTL